MCSIVRCLRWSKEALRRFLRNSGVPTCSFRSPAVAGVEVFFVRDLLKETVRDPEARKWLLDRRVGEEIVGVGLAQHLHAALMKMDVGKLSNHVIGGMNVVDDFYVLEYRNVDAGTVRNVDTGRHARRGSAL